MLFRRGEAGDRQAGGRTMTIEDDRAFHLERAVQCRKMAEEASDPAVRTLHEQLARFHDAEANRELVGDSVSDGRGA